MFGGFGVGSRKKNAYCRIFQTLLGQYPDRLIVHNINTVRAASSDVGHWSSFDLFTYTYSY
jgi:hypothetical protein